MLRPAVKERIRLAFVLLLLLGLIFIFDFAYAELPQELFFQARLTEKNRGVLIGSHQIKFRLYSNLSGGSALWTETHTLTPDNSGVISCYLGSVTSFPSDINFNSVYYISLEVDSDGEMTPRVKLVPSFGAFNSKRLGGLIPGQFLRSDTAATMSGAFSLSNYLAQTYSGTDASAMSINYNPASGSYNALDLTYGSGGGKGAALKITQSGTGDIVQVYDADGAVMLIKHGGNVGIGTASPTQKLEVKGTVKATAFSGDGNALSGISGLISGLTTGRLTKAGSSTSLTDSLIIESGGNIGIGTSSPGRLFDVRGGAIRTDDQLISTLATGTAPLAVTSATVVSNLNADKLDGFDSADFASAGTFTEGVTNYLAKYTASNTVGSSAIIYDNGTNIGIGTADPALAKLQVKGSIYAGAFSDDGLPVSADTAQAYLSSSLGSGLIKIAGSGALSVISDNSSDWESAYAQRISSVSATAPLTLSLANNVLSGAIFQATATVDGYLSSADWNTFNNKQDALVFSTGLTDAANTVSVNLSTGIAGGQSVIGGTLSANNLILSSTSHAVKGKIIFGSASAYDQVNDRLGLGTTAASAKLDIVGAGTGIGIVFRARDNSGADKVAILDNGNIGLGTSNPRYKLEIVGDIKFTGCIKQGGLGDLAEMMRLSPAVISGADKAKEKAKPKPWFNFFAKKKKPQVVEQADNRALYCRPEPGEVVIIDKDAGIRRSFQAYATNAVGIISTRPAQLLRDDIENALPVALSGIVPCKVTNENGAIEPGDLLVCSSVPGHAMRAGNSPPIGSVIGKAIGRLAKAQKTGLIDVLVTLK